MRYKTKSKTRQFPHVGAAVSMGYHLHGGGGGWRFVSKPIYKRSVNIKDFSWCFYLHFTYDREKCQLSKVKIIF